MQQRSVGPRTNSFWRTQQRLLVKGSLFLAFAIVVLNPNLRRAILQVGHMLHPEQLIQTRFAGLGAISAQVDRALASDRGRHSEPKLVARFVLRRIRYITDYENWGNVEYWPTAQEVWNKRQEDCDGRAILAASILRARGFHSANLVAGLDHMWIFVDENEKDRAKPPHFIALLSPNPNFSLELHEESAWRDLVRLAKALLHPANLRDTFLGVLSDIPPFRKAILVAGLLLICGYPCKHRRRLLLLLAAGLAAVVLVEGWHPGDPDLVRVSLGCGLLIVSIVAAFVLSRAARLSYPETPQQGRSDSTAEPSRASWCTSTA